MVTGPWVVPHHSLSRAYGRPQRLRRLLGQPILYTGDLQCAFGFVSKYNQTIFLRQVLLPNGQWVVEYSPVIYSTDAYKPAEEVHRILEEEKLAELKKFLDKKEVPMGNS
ncbi:hypothetical protein N7497_000386 [Penicillium chrysogenum]|nr:hypothetical protein N7497_000386 [Penicillium chrysogenum]